jgi:hypothetical protein
MNAKHASLVAWALVVAVGVGCSGKIESIPDGNSPVPSGSGAGIDVHDGDPHGVG